MPGYTSRELSDAEYIIVGVSEPGYSGATSAIVNRWRRPNSPLVLSREAIVLKPYAFSLEVRHDSFDVRDFPSKNSKFLGCQLGAS